MIEIEVEDQGLPDRLRRLARRLEDPEAVLADVGGHWQRRVKKSMPDHGPRNPEPADPGEPPAVHTSEYVHSIIYDYDPDALYLGSSSIRARILQEGGTIRPRHSKALAIPIAAESYGRRPRDFGELDYIPPQPGEESEDRGILALPGVEEEFTPLFALRSSVTLHPHPHLEFTRDDRVYMGEAIEEAADEEML